MSASLSCLDQISWGACLGRTSAAAETDTRFDSKSSFVASASLAVTSNLLEQKSEWVWERDREEGASRKQEASRWLAELTWTNLRDWKPKKYVRALLTVIQLFDQKRLSWRHVSNIHFFFFCLFSISHSGQETWFSPRSKWSDGELLVFCVVQSFFCFALLPGSHD